MKWFYRPKKTNFDALKKLVMDYTDNLPVQGNLRRIANKLDESLDEGLERAVGAGLLSGDDVLQTRFSIAMFFLREQLLRMRPDHKI
jgi:hypothetical protein